MLFAKIGGQLIVPLGCSIDVCRCFQKSLEWNMPEMAQKDGHWNGKIMIYQ